MDPMTPPTPPLPLPQTTTAEDGALDTLASALPDGTSLRTRISSSAAAGAPPATADDLIQAQARVAAANPAVVFQPLDESALEGCGADCLMGHLHDAAQRMGGVLEPAGPSAALVLPGGGSLPLDSGAARLFASELGALHGAAREKLRARSGAAGSDTEDGDDEDVAVFHSTLVGLQALKQHAARSGAAAADTEAQVAAAVEALTGVVREMAVEFERAFARDVVYQITLLGDAAGGADGGGEDEGGSGGGEGGLESWRQATRRSLLQVTLGAPAAADGSNSSAADAKAFANKATSYGVALLLIYITAAVLYAMVNMPFKQVGGGGVVWCGVVGWVGCVGGVSLTLYLDASTPQPIHRTTHCLYLSPTHPRTRSCGVVPRPTDS